MENQPLWENSLYQHSHVQLLCFSLPKGHHPGSQARAMSFAGAGWSNLLQNTWPVFGILRRIRDHLRGAPWRGWLMELRTRKGGWVEGMQC